jgi:tRNA U55 pseudouridine synthase TruB
MSKIPFKSIADYIDEIEKGFVARESPEEIARRLGVPDKAKTIRRYKAAVWDLRDLVAEGKEERARRHEKRRNKAKAEIIKTLDLIEKIKAKAYHHLDWAAGDGYTTSEGERIATPGQVINWHAQAAEMAAKAIKAELELSGDDPGSKMASSFLELIELAERGAGQKDS